MRIPGPKNVPPVQREQSIRGSAQRYDFGPEIDTNWDPPKSVRALANGFRTPLQIWGELGALLRHPKTVRGETLTGIVNFQRPEARISGFRVAKPET